MGAFLGISNCFNVAILNGGFNLPIALENQDFDPRLGDPYLAAFLLPASVIQSTLGLNGCETTSGIYQIDINYPAEKGVTALLSKADEVNAVFYNGAALTLNAFTVNLKNVSRSRVIVAGGFASVSLFIEFYSINSRF